MATAVMLSRQRIDYKKKDNTEVKANNVSFLVEPSSDYERRGLTGSLVITFYVRDDNFFSSLISSAEPGSVWNLEHVRDFFGHEVITSLSAYPDAFFELPL